MNTWHEREGGKVSMENVSGSVDGEDDPEAEPEEKDSGSGVCGEGD